MENCFLIIVLQFPGSYSGSGSLRVGSKKVSLKACHLGKL